MPTYTSPGVYLVEQDFSEFAPTVNSSVAAVIGFASKGPTNKATLITSAKQLFDTFGRPDSVNHGEHTIMGALEILKRTNNLYFVRPSDGSDTAANFPLEMGFCPAVIVSGESGVNGGIANYNVRVSSVIDGEGNERLSDVVDFTFAAGSDASSFIANLKSAAEGISTIDTPFSVELSSVNDTSCALVGAYSGSAARLAVSISSGTVYSVCGAGDTRIHAVDLDAPGAAGGGIIASGSQAVKNAFNFTVSSHYTGAGYNASTDTLGNQAGLQVHVKSQRGPNQLLYVYENGNLVETFSLNLSGANPTNSAWIQDLITNDLDTTKSSVLLGEVNASCTYSRTAFDQWYDTLSTADDVDIVNGAGAIVANKNPIFPKFLSSEIGNRHDLSAGTNGDNLTYQLSSYTGAAHAAARSGLYAIDDDSLNISIACVPGVTNQVIQNDLITLAENSQNFIAVLNTPEALTPQEAVSWHNGGGSLRTAAINSSYAAIYYPWLQVFNSFTGSLGYVTPDAYAVATMVHTDNVTDPWFAPAGVVRGRLTKPVDVQYVVNAGERQTLYSGGNVINPISKFTPDGIVIYGQRTAQRNPSATDRLDVRRMMILLRKMVIAATQTFVFEPNDPLTWSRVTDTINPLLDDISRRRGITDFKVICDETTNTPLRVDRNELWCQVRIKPTKTAEVIIFEVNITNQSASL